MQLGESHIRRYWERVINNGNNSCWGWNGSVSKGYGQMSYGHKKPPLKVHRVSWIIHYGEIPKHMEVCHHCDTPACSNPKHLFLGTHKDNMTDAFKKGRINNFTHGTGEKGNSAKLTNLQVKSIRDAYTTTSITCKEIASQYRVCVATIRKIVRNKIYVDKGFIPINGNRKPRPYRRKSTAQRITN